MTKINSLSVLFFALVPSFFVGCDGKPAESTAKIVQKTGDGASKFVAVTSFNPDLPENLTTLTLSDAKVQGLCFLDALNGSLFGDKPTAIKSETKITFDGWAVYDTNPATLGEVVAVQLTNEKQSYFAVASSYVRLGLGAALGNAKLDGGGLLMKDVYLSVPAGVYRVLFLTQSGNDLKRCDTYRILKVE